MPVNPRGLLAGMLVLCASLTGCEVQESGTETRFAAPAGTSAAEVTAPTNAPETAAVTPAAAPAGIWPAYNAPDFLVHGYEGEGAYRDAAIAAARAAGLNAIRFDGSNPPNDEVAMFTLHFRSPVDGHFMNKADSSWAKAQAAGVTRWVIDIGDGSQMDRWRYLTKDYPPHTVQFLVNGAVVPQ